MNHLPVNANTCLTYKVAETEEERSAYFRIREEVYRDQPGQPDGSHSFQDERALIIVALRNGEILGGARLCLYSRNPILPIELGLPNYRELLPPEIVVGDDCAEYGGLALHSKGLSPAIAQRIHLFAEDVARSHGIRHALLVTEPLRARLHRRAYKLAHRANPQALKQYRVIGEFPCPPDSPYSAWVEQDGRLVLSVICFDAITFKHSALSTRI